MGGRGARSGLSASSTSGGGGGGGYGGYGSLQGLISEKNAAGNSNNANDPSDVGDYTDDNNPALLKYQGQDDDKTANFLASVWRNTDYSQYADGYDYYTNGFQALVLRLGLDKGPMVLSDKDFNDYVRQTGAEIKWRGVSGKDAADRFMQAAHNHTGSGIYGDGHYYSNNKRTATSYGESAARSKGGRASDRVVMKMALSPKARVIDYSDLRARMSGASSKLQSSLSRAGQSGATNGYGGNDGEAQYALKLGYNVIRVSSGSNSYEYALTRDALVVSTRRY